MQTVLITGASGVIGSALVPLFLKDDSTKLYLLLRADSSEYLQQRLKRLGDYWGIDPDTPEMTARLIPLRGDVCQPQLGLTAAEYQNVIQTVTHVIHCAGSVKLNQPLETARVHAVDAARHVVKLCKDAAQVGQFKKLEFVSTVGVAGRITGLVSEQPLRQSRRFHNTYEQAKAEAETYLLGEMKAGLPATIHRPSMVVGNSQTGKIMHFQVFYHLCEFLSGRRTYGILPNFGDWRLDIIPSDYVAKAISLSSNQPHALGKIFHLCSGPEHALPLAELAPWMNRLLVRPGEKPYRICTLPRGWIRNLMLLLSLCVGPKTRRALQTLPHFLAYLDEKPMFDNRATQAFFDALGLKIPPVKGYVNTLIQYYLESRQTQSGLQADSTNLTLVNQS